MNSREHVIRKISERESRKDPIRQKERHLFHCFAELVFHEGVQKERLNPAVFEALQKTIKNGEELGPALADSIAKGLQEWALEKGATHFCHWFQPLTDLTAEKHDSFFVPISGGSWIAEFNGKMLVRGEPDASSFPSGGLRTTFEARGYTAWDPSSPPFILGRTLVIPSVFLSWLGDSLDKKTPLLRSMDALNEQALRVLRLFSDTETMRVLPTVGSEQEYFLIDKFFSNLRPDLISCGRTLFGAKPSKGQELEDQYLSSISERVVAFMEEVEFELLRLGIPVKTRHNEVAPSQYELANTFEIANIAADHQMLVMEILRKVACRHGMECLLHEKPFANINGSGKHNNWSLITDLGKNLLEPGETPFANAQFLLFCAAVVRGIHKYAQLLRMSVASAGNDHRLGHHEAPPAIISVFLGEQLYNIFQKLIKKENPEDKIEEELKLGISMLPRIPRHFSDRNRTSPFAFTGNKFEFRAVGSGENISEANTTLNTLVAESLDFFASYLEETQGEFNQKLQDLLAQTASEFQPILFEGDNYNQEWHKEAEKRGLPNHTNAVDALMLYTSRESVALFTKYKVYSLRELISRQEIALSKYIKKILIETRTCSSIAHTMILPAVMRYIRELGDAMTFLSAADQEILKAIIKEFGLLRKSLHHLDDVLQKIPHDELNEKAFYCRDKLAASMNYLRSHADRLEEMIDDAYWPLPKYTEMLFIR